MEIMNHSNPFSSKQNLFSVLDFFIDGSDFYGKKLSIEMYLHTISINIPSFDFYMLILNAIGFDLKAT